MPQLCRIDGCKKHALFNTEGEKRPLYCSSHKADGMVNVRKKKCLYNGCEIVPAYNTKGVKGGLYCSTHKADGMVDVKTKKCLHNGCEIVPAYNTKREKIPLYCSTHKADGMVDVTKKCLHNGCEICSNYNTKGEKTGIYCSTHKADGMVDVKTKKCLYNGCEFVPGYNTKGEKTGIYCLKHKLDGMVDVKTKKCLHNGCEIIPSCNIEGEKIGIYCSSHKADGMVNVTNKKCLHEWCLTQANKKYEDYCLNCYMHVYPDRPVTRNYKTKEYSVVEFIQKSFPDFTWITDKKVSDGCSRRRPDMLLDLGDQVVIVEVDENQHTGYDCSCENKRLMELSQDVGHRPVVFIRFNPDDYLDNGTKVNSCWGVNKMGICAVKKTYARAWALRLDALAESISYWTTTENRTDKTVEVVELFYDR